MRRTTRSSTRTWRRRCEGAPWGSGADAGAWAYAFMIHKSKERSIADTKKILYPQVAKHGWERALAEFAQVKDKQAYYKEFRAFLKTPLEAQLKMLETLED